MLTKVIITMCGIFGYKGNKECEKILLNGLKALDYRGYDSWGIALKSNDDIRLFKDIGKVNVGKKLGEGKIGIGHTRWATHGGVTKENAHPHHDSDEDIYVVHNGIIENADEIKDLMTGVKFYSDTDSEVIPKLIRHFVKEGDEFEKAAIKAANMFKGNFAFVAIKKDSDKMIAARNGSPLVIGKGDGEFFIASDMLSFLKYTKDVYFLNDGEIAIINNKIIFRNLEGEPIDKELKRINIEAKDATKGEYKHFMLKEIYEQPEAIRKTIKQYCSNGKIDLDFGIKDVSRIIITACGTSWHSALVGKYWIESIARIPVETEYASEFRYRDPVINKDDIIIAISQSGETADTIAAIKEAKEKGARVISICNVQGSTIARISDKCLFTIAGPEIGVASTKAFTTQLAVLYMIALYLGNKEHVDELKKIPELVESVLKEEDIIQIMEAYYDKTNALFLGRGVNYPIALEGALKLKEISYIHAEGYPAAEMKHGPIALIDKEMPTVFICVKDKSYDKVISNIEEVKARDGKVIAIATEKDEKISKLADNVIYVPKTIDELTPFVTVVPLQLLAYHIADKRGCEIDKPRNLAKSVTVE